MRGFIPFKLGVRPSGSIVSGPPEGRMDQNMKHPRHSRSCIVEQIHSLYTGQDLVSSGLHRQSVIRIQIASFIIHFSYSGEAKGGC